MRPNFLIAALVGLIPSVAFASGPTGRIVVINDSGAPMNVMLAGRESRTVADHERVMLIAPIGDQALRATYSQLGRMRTLDAEMVSVQPYETTVVTLHPDRNSRVRVTNDTSTAATVFADGRLVASLEPGGSQVVRVRVGAVAFEMTSESGRTLEERDMFVAPYAENAWIVSRPTTADLVVSNPLQIPVTVDGAGGSRQIPAFGRVVFDDVPIGTLHLIARRTSGQVVDEDTVAVRADGGTWRVDPPRFGLVALTSSAGAPVTVLSDGVTVGHLDAWGNSVAELSVGWHEIVVVDGRGRQVEDRWIEVDPFDLASLTVDGHGGDPHPDARDGYPRTEDAHAHHEVADGRSGDDDRDGYEGHHEYHR